MTLGQSHSKCVCSQNKHWSRSGKSKAHTDTHTLARLQDAWRKKKMKRGREWRKRWERDTKRAEEEKCQRCRLWGRTMASRRHLC